MNLNVMSVAVMVVVVRIGVKGIRCDTADGSK